MIDNDLKDTPLIQRDILKCWQAEQELLRKENKSIVIEHELIKQDLRLYKQSQEKAYNVLDKQVEKVRDKSHALSGDVHKLVGQMQSIFKDIGYIRNSQEKTNNDITFIKEKLNNTEIERSEKKGTDKVLSWILQKAAAPIITTLAMGLIGLLIVKGVK